MIGTIGPMRSRNDFMCSNHALGSFPVGVQTQVKLISGCSFS
jgi:hypothetical protein